MSLMSFLDTVQQLFRKHWKRGGGQNQSKPTGTPPTCPTWLQMAGNRREYNAHRRPKARSSFIYPSTLDADTPSNPRVTTERTNTCESGVSRVQRSGSKAIHFPKPLPPVKEYQEKRCLSQYPAPEKIKLVSLESAPIRSNQKTNSFTKVQSRRRERLRGGGSQRPQPGAVAHIGAAPDDITEGRIYSSSLDDAPNGDFLVEASLVVETEESLANAPLQPPTHDASPDLVAAEAINPGKQKKAALLMMILGGVLVGGAVIAGVLFGVVFEDSPVDANSAGFTSSPSTSPTMAPTITKGQPEFADRLSLLLPDFSIRAIDEDPSGPQARALQWMAMDENFEGYENPILLRRFALATFYFATGGPNWKNHSGWLTDSDDCSWFDLSSRVGGERCKSGVRTGLVLEDNGLVGTLPPEIGLLSDLEVLSLSKCQTVGQIPSEVGLLTNLVTFIGYDNAWTGAIPTTIGLMTELQVFDLDNNPLNSKYARALIDVNLGSTHQKSQPQSQLKSGY